MFCNREHKKTCSSAIQRTKPKPVTMMFCNMLESLWYNAKWKKKEKHKIPSPFRLWIWKKEKTDAKTKILKTNQESEQWVCSDVPVSTIPTGECLGTQEEGISPRSWVLRGIKIKDSWMVLHWKKTETRKKRDRQEEKREAPSTIEEGSEERNLKHSDVTELACCLGTRPLLVLPPSVKSALPTKAYGPGVSGKGIDSAGVVLGTKQFTVWPKLEEGKSYTEIVAGYCQKPKESKSRGLAAGGPSWDLSYITHVYFTL